MAYKLVIFDLDGTVLDTGEGIFSAIRHTVSELGLKQPSEKEVKSFVGPPIGQSFKRVFNLDDAGASQAVAVFRKYYSGGDMYKAAVYGGITELLEGLGGAGIRSAVATLKYEPAAKDLLDKFGIDRYTCSICGADSEGKLKKSDIIKRCVADAGITDLTKVVLVGDTVNDANGASNAGIDFLAVTYGYGFKNKDDLNGIANIGCAASPYEILHILCG